MRNSLLNKCLTVCLAAVVLGIAGCGTIARYPGYKPVAPVQSTMPEQSLPVLTYGDFEKLVFNTNVTVYGYKLSGLLVVKRIDPVTFRAVFMKEFGVKLLDMESGEKGMTVHYAIKQLNRKAVLRNLEKKIRLIMTKNDGLPEAVSSADGTIMAKYRWGGDTNYYFSDAKNAPLRWLENTTEKIRNLTLHWLENTTGKYKNLKVMFSDMRQVGGVTVPKNAVITDYNIKLKVELALLQADETIIE